MKKLMTFLLLFTLIGCGVTSEDNSVGDNIICKKEKVEYHVDHRDRVTTIQIITYDELVEKMNSSTDFLLYIGRPDCPDCEEFYPLLEEYLAKQNYGIYYLNIKEFRDAARKEGASQEEVAFYESLQERLKFAWVPSLQRWVNGELVDSYQYLSVEYYSIESTKQKAEEKENYIEEFKEWFVCHYGE